MKRKFERQEEISYATTTTSKEEVLSENVRWRVFTRGKSYESECVAVQDLHLSYYELFCLK